MQDKTVLVTGGAKRVGAAIVRRLHAAGANVAIHCRSSLHEALALRDELNELRPGSAAAMQADLLETAALPRIIEETVRQFGRLDALVNNASSFFPTPLAEMKEQDWNDLLGTNLKAPVFLAQACAAELRRRHGCIVNIVDIHAELPMHGHLLYNIAKSGLAGLTRALAQELAPQVRVNGVAPGVNIWPESGAWQDEEQRRKLVARTLLKREGEPDDIARTVQFLIADAPYITGQIIAVDGGRSINI
ncbi:3-oxoacyl-[acyl-carrier-protein] reductase FabG [Sideroxyarcus emersonii]|uniref:3-oxoacyl-[acyl-carrier-protein] reductase FabG n=1 Tax=Sideroxyarcus emersonii TaxID=2764705 RepID=A0AAN2BY51_9PROT|nr:pteridine reductase [Sideroxyarcus emersonii]BCK86377.1 3-oxoacyl-[acyl-carrier-protein] reductase FabG [Sideroxyarcus emersonii]